MSEAVDFFMRQILLLAIVLVLHTYIGLHIIRRTLIFSDLVLDQLAAFGALIGIGIGVQYGTGGSYLVSLAFVLLGAYLLAAIKPENRLIPREAVIGILYAMALVATLLLGDKLSGGSAHVTKTLAGSMLWVTWPLVIVTAVTYAGLILFHVVFRERFISLTRGREAPASARFWDFLLFATQGIITVLIVPIAGVLLAYAFLMVPAATAAMFTKGWGRAVLLGWAIGYMACLAGLTTSYCCDLPYGPTLVLCLGVCFLVGAVVRAAVAREMN
jgi:zinc/manganese transport system permease protein